MRTKKRINAEGGAGTSTSASADTTTAAAAAPLAEGEAVAIPSRKKPRMESNSNTETNANNVTASAQPATSSADAVPSTSAGNGNNETTATASTSNVQPAATATSSTSTLSADDDREQVFQFVFCSGSQEYLKYLDEKPELGVGADRLKALQILKTNENIDSAAKAIQRHKFTIDQMPAHLLEQQKIWDILLPTLSTRSLLHHFHTMKDHGFLNDDSEFTRKFLNVFGKSNTLKSENICPINVYIQKELYKQNMRYLCLKKAEYYKKKMQKRKVTTNSAIAKRLDEMFEQTLRNAKPMPAKFFIVMDLRRGNAKSKSYNTFDGTLGMAQCNFF